jgi:hypothetical protein
MNSSVAVTFASLAILVSGSTPTTNQPVAVVSLCTSRYVLRFVVPRGWSWDPDKGELWPVAKRNSGPILLNCSRPPRNRDYRDFETRMKKEISVEREINRSVKVNPRRVGSLRGVEIRLDRYMRDPQRTVIEMYVDVPDDHGGGELFMVGLDALNDRDLLHYHRAYEQIFRTATVAHDGE